MLRRFVFVFVAAIVFGCSAPGLLGPINEEERSQSGVISVNVVGKSKTVTSFTADVTVVQKDNRSTHGFQRVGRYKLSSKLVDGIVKSRMEVYDDSNKVVARMVQGTTEMVAMDNSGKVMGRMALPVTNALNELLNGRQSFRISGRIANFSTLRMRASRLNFDTAEDISNHVLTISVPNSLVSSTEYKVKSYRLFFDTINENLSGTETVGVEPDGTTTTIKTTEVYQQFDGITYHVGTITDIDRHVPRTNDLTGYGFPAVPTNISELPIITEEKIEETRKEGGQVWELDPVLGDPASLDTSDTMQEAYLNVQVNPELNDSDFSAVQ